MNNSQNTPSKLSWASWCSLFGLLALLLLAAPQKAQADSSTSTAAAAKVVPAKKPPPGFEPVPGGQARAESVSASKLVVMAYGGIFLILFGYVVYVVRKQAAVADDIRRLEAKINRSA